MTYIRIPPNHPNVIQTERCPIVPPAWYVMNCMGPGLGEPKATTMCFQWTERHQWDSGLFNVIPLMVWLGHGPMN